MWMNLSYLVFGYGHPRHMLNAPPDKALALWEMLAAGKIDEIEREPWRPGYGPNAS